MSEPLDHGVLTGPRAREWLRQCARGRRPIFVSVLDNAQIYRGVLRSAQRTLTVLMSDPSDPPPLHGTVCSLYLQLQGLGASFVSHTLEYQQPANAADRLTLSMPHAIATIEPRRAFRIPADAETPVRIVATGLDHVLVGTLANLSRVGLSFLLDRPTPSCRGDIVSLDLTWPGGHATVDGRIAQLTRDLCAVSFDPHADLASNGIATLVCWQQRSQLRRREA